MSVILTQIEQQIVIMGNITFSLSPTNYLYLLCIFLMGLTKSQHDIKIFLTDVTEMGLSQKYLVSCRLMHSAKAFIN